MKYVGLIALLQVNSKEFHFIIVYKENLFTEYFNDTTLFQMNRNKSLNILLQEVYQGIGHSEY